MSAICRFICCKHKSHIFPFNKTRKKIFGVLHRSKSSVFTTDIAVGNTSMKLSSGQLARFADGCAVAHMGETSVMVTAVGKTKQSSSGFLPLTVDYRQKAAAAGRIPTNFFRRELGPSEHEILTSRLIDRSLRPLFHNNYFYETQLICNILAMDGIYDPVILAINASSLALALSDIPWTGPIGAVRVGMIGNEVVINPSRRELSASSLDMVVTSANQNLVIMIEASANCILQQELMKAIKAGVKECQTIVSAISQLQKIHGKEKRVYESTNLDEELMNMVKSLSGMRLREIFQDFSHDKVSRDDAVKVLRNDVFEKMKVEKDITLEQYSDIFNSVCKSVFRNLILDEEIRCDGRSLTDLRNISCSVDLFKPLHGSALFQRGQTQVLCTISLDSLNSALHVDPMTAIVSGLKEKNFFLHYEFPPYATNDIGRMGPAVRREVGHGALAERSIRPVIPSGFPFTIRLTSEVLESNGSSSMASVCGGSLALFDAGVPISSPVAGVAVGLVTEYENGDTKHIKNYKILTDILGIEDYMGDMDFKMAGTKKGITALQADIKIPGLPLKIVMEALMAGSDAKSKILGIMSSAIHEPRQDKKDSWPIDDKLDVPINKRGKLIGMGGVNLKKILINTGTQISFDEDSGLFNIFAPNLGALNEAKDYIDKLLSSEKEPTLEFGGVYTAKIVEIRDNGVMVTLYNNMKPALLHVSQLDQRRVIDAKALGLEVGQEFPVKYFGLDPVSGQMRLSRKVLMGPNTGSLINNFKS